MVKTRTGYDKHSYEVLAEYSDLEDGTTRSGVLCPACEGGATKEGSLSVSRRGDVLLWTCHRASCPFKGRINTASPGTSGGGGQSRSRQDGIKTYPIDQSTLGFLATKFGIPRASLELAGLRWTGDGDGTYGKRVCYPIFGPSSRKRGENYRSYQGAQPKSLIKLFEDDAVASCWYRWKRKSDILVLVEDQVSAIKLAPHYDSLALLGTNLSESKAQEIIDGPKYKYIYICLDNDATYEAIKMQLAWKKDIPNMRVLGLDKDIKDFNEVEFDDFMLRLI